MALKYVLMLLLSLSYVSCGHENGSSSDAPAPEGQTETPTNPLEYVELITRDGDRIRTSIAYKSKDQKQGLSGVRPEDFAGDQGKLFFYFSEATRTFWMPNTFFPLDVFYLNDKLKIESIVRDLPFSPEDANEDTPRAPAIRSRHVLELRSDSAIGDKLQIGDELGWDSEVGLKEIEPLMRNNM